MTRHGGTWMLKAAGGMSGFLSLSFLSVKFGQMAFCRILFGLHARSRLSSELLGRLSPGRKQQSD